MQYIICDIDGTVAKIGDRIKYLQQKPKAYKAFYEACEEDTVIEPIKNLIYILKHPYTIVFCTGRKEYVRDKTYNWLKNYIMGCDMENSPLLMRAENDNRADVEVKPELLNRWMQENNIQKEDIICIFEDRTQMVSKWRELGFTCLQVNDGNF